MNFFEAKWTPAWSTTRSFFLLLTILAFIPYLQTLDFGFVADDHIYLGLANHAFWQLNWGTLWKLLVTPHNPWEFLPVRDFSYWLDFKLGGDDAAAFHTGNLVWYGFACAAVCWTTQEILHWAKPEWRERNAALAMLATAFFAWHPAHVEAVAWIAGRKDLLAGGFCLVGWGGLIRAARKEWAARELAVSWLILLLACFSKSVAVSVFAIGAYFSLVFAWQCAAAIRRRALGYGTLSLLGFFIIASLHWAVGRHLGIQFDNAPGWAALVERASRILASLMELTFAPFDLRVIHDVYAVARWHWGVSCVAGAAVLMALVALLRDCERLLTQAVLWLIFPCVLYLQILPFSTWSMASERFVFLPIFGAALLLIYCLGRVRQAAVVMTVGGTIIAVSAFVTVCRIPVWADERALWRQEAKINPGYFNAVQNHVVGLALSGRIAEASAVVSGLSREDARRLLQSYLAFRAKGNVVTGGGVQDKAEYCQYGAQVLVLIQSEYVKTAFDKDIPYRNLLRNIERDLNPNNRFVRTCVDFL